jgi:hypothetical protein
VTRSVDVRGKADDAAPPSLAAAGGGCMALPSPDLFGAVRPLPDCLGGSLFRRTGTRDINRDGIEEVVDIANESVSIDRPRDICLAERREIAIDQGEETTTRQSVLSRLKIMPYLQSVAELHGTSVVAFQAAGRHDTDRHGDLDLRVVISVARNSLIENASFQSRNPLAGDLNVDSADLAIRLGGWTGI